MLLSVYFKVLVLNWVYAFSTNTLRFEVVPTQYRQTQVKTLLGMFAVSLTYKRVAAELRTDVGTVLYKLFFETF